MPSSLPDTDVEQLIREHHALVGHYAQVQARCSELVRQQAGEIERLRAQTLRLRAQLIARDTALAWAREDRAALEASIPGLPRRAALARTVETLLQRVHDLLQERLRWQWRSAPLRMPVMAASPSAAIADHTVPHTHLGALEASLVAADLVICQTGCLSHGDYWRVQDHCKRTGKACVLVEQPEAVRIVRIHQPLTPSGTAAKPTAEEQAVP